MTTPEVPTPESVPGPVEGAPNATAARRSRWQFGLRSMLAATALVAVWTAHVNNRRVIRDLEGRIESIRHLARELEVTDPARFASVKLDALWYDENRWDLHVPDGSFRVCLATRGIEQNEFPADFRWRPLPPGRRSMELKQSSDADGQRISVLVDGSPLVEAVEPKEWLPSAGTSTNEMNEGKADPSKPDRRPLVFRRRFMVPKGQGSSAAPDGPGGGILMWIERYDPEAPGPGGDSSKTPTGRDASPSPTSDAK